MIQTITVIILLVLSIVYLALKLKKEFSGKGSCDGCGSARGNSKRVEPAGPPPEVIWRSGRGQQHTVKR